jgi:uncharacterized membrane protein YhhN
MTRLEAWTSRRHPPRPFRTVRVVVAVVAFGLVSILDLVAEAASWKQAALMFRLLAMPLLTTVLIMARGGGDRIVRLVIAALLFSWLGDTIGGVDQLLKLCFFLLAHVCYIIAFWPERRSSMLVRPWALVGYVILLIVMGVLLLPRAGGLAVPVMIYGCAVVLMAVLAGGLGRIGTIGGLVFVISDALIGILWFYRPSPVGLMDFSIMLSYLVAQTLLVTAVILRGDRPATGHRR